MQRLNIITLAVNERKAARLRNGDTHYEVGATPFGPVNAFRYVHERTGILIGYAAARGPFTLEDDHADRAAYGDDLPTGLTDLPADLIIRITGELIPDRVRLDSLHRIHIMQVGRLHPDLESLLREEPGYGEVIA